MKLSLMRNYEEVAFETHKTYNDDLFAPHERASKKIIFDSKRKVVSEAKLGDYYQVFYIVGGGGGHALSIHSLDLTVSSFIPT